MVASAGHDDHRSAISSPPCDISPGVCMMAALANGDWKAMQVQHEGPVGGRLKPVRVYLF